MKNYRNCELNIYINNKIYERNKWDRKWDTSIHNQEKEFAYREVEELIFEESLLEWWWFEEIREMYINFRDWFWFNIKII